MIMKFTRTVVVCVGLLVLGAARVYAQDSLSTARDLYASAEYDNALTILERLSIGPSSNEERQSIELYRALSLLAVGRREDADRTIESIVRRDPLFRPGEDLSPRTQLAFNDARKRVLPSVIQQEYAAAKGAFERKEFETSANLFKRVVELLNDAAVGDVAQQPPLADLRTLAAGFHDLSVKAIPPPPPPALPAPVAVAPPVNVPPRVYSAEDRGIIPPQTIAQTLPRYPGAVPPRGVSGVVEVVINEGGTVETASVVVPVSSSYDKMLMTAANKWQYVPASFNGKPVKFRKRIQVTVTPPATP